MNEEKRNRILAAVTVNVILLIVILAAVVIYQLVEITSISRRRAQIEDKIAVYRTQTENAQNTLDYYKSYEGLLDKAYEFGFVFGK
ncbi:MAG TPA: hypothetical protein DD415_03905 [Clostridiales bacterium]|nr:hypothetical protein [Clostridiales bacterium]